jgi:hypothetical protein
MRIADTLKKFDGLRTTGDMYVRFYEPTSTDYASFLEEYELIPEEFFNDTVRIFILLERLEKIIAGARYFGQFEYRLYKDMLSAEVIDYSTNSSKSEVKINFNNSGMSGEQFESWLDEHFPKIGIFFGSEERNFYRSYINGYFFECNTNSVYLSLDDPFPDLQIGMTYQIYTVNSWGLPEDILLNFRRKKKEILTILGHRKDGLPTDLEFIDGQWKLYKDVHDSYDNLSLKNIIEILKLDFDYDYSRFINHVRFGSAYAKIINCQNKLNQIRNLENTFQYLDLELTWELALLWDEANYYWNNNIKILDKQKAKNDLNAIIDSLTPFEKWVFVNHYLTKTEVQFNNWVTAQRVAAQQFDENNEEWLISLTPPWFTENDTTGYFTNFILLMGEFYDNIWVYMNSFGNLREIDINKNPEMSMKIVYTILKDLGFDKDINYDIVDVKDYFGDPTNIKKVSTIFTKRILANLSFLYKKKGTTQNMQYILNLFGIPRDLFDLVEYGSVSKNVGSEIFKRENSWIVTKPQDSTIRVLVDNTDFDQDEHSLELIFNNFEGFNSELIKFNSNNSILLEQSSSLYRIRVLNDGNSVYSSSFDIRQNDAWTYFGLTINNLTSSFYLADQDFSGNGLMNIKSGSFYLDDTWDTFSYIDLAPSSSIALTEFRIFDKALDNNEMFRHASDFRSVAESDPENPTLVTRFKFKPSAESSSEIYAQNGNFTASLLGLSTSSFSTDEFFNVSKVEVLQGTDLNAEKIRIEDRQQFGQLNAENRVTQNTYDVFPNDPPIFGLYLSPSSKINLDLIRRVSDYISFVPDDLNNDFDYLFDELENLKDKILLVDENVRTLTSYQTILKYYNKKIFKIVKEFVPASVTFEYGLLIKNSILKRNRYLSNRKEILWDWNTEGIIVQNNPITSEESKQEIYISILPETPTLISNRQEFFLPHLVDSTPSINAFSQNISIKKLTEIRSNVENYYDAFTRILEVPVDRKFDQPDQSDNVVVDTKNYNRPSPWLRAIIRGPKVELRPSIEVQYYDNAGIAIEVI